MNGISKLNDSPELQAQLMNITVECVRHSGNFPTMREREKRLEYFEEKINEAHNILLRNGIIV